MKKKSISSITHKTTKKMSVKDALRLLLNIRHDNTEKQK